MTFAPVPHHSATSFVIFIQHLDKRLDGSFRPRAVVGFDAGLRASGFLGSVPAEELRTLLFLLSFVTPNGDISPSLSQISEFMRVSTSKARARLERLVDLRWQGARIVQSHQIAGRQTFSPVPELAPTVEERVQGWHQLLLQPPPLHGVAPGGSREAVIEHSRRTYGRPREEVEAEIRAFYGQREAVAPDAAAQEGARRNARESEEEQAVWERLVAVGLTDEQANSLLDRFDLVRIGRQLQWLPFHRRVRNVAGFLIAAIEDDYEMPPSLRRQVPAPELPPEGDARPAEQAPPDAADADVPSLDASSLHVGVVAGEDAERDEQAPS